MKKTLFIASVIAVLAISSCGTETRIGLSGKQVEKTVKVSGTYSELSVSNAINVRYSSTAEEATVIADSAVIPYICVEETGKRLRIYMSMKQNLRFKSGDMGNVTVTVPASSSIAEIRISGASDFESDMTICADVLAVEVSGASDFRSDLDVPSRLSISASGASDFRSSVSAGVMSIDASGASDVMVGGLADRMEVTASGASSVSSGRNYVETGAFSCDLSGASSCHVKCSGPATGEASGASTVVVYGEGSISIDASGASNVHRR